MESYTACSTVNQFCVRTYVFNVDLNETAKIHATPICARPPSSHWPPTLSLFKLLHYPSIHDPPYAYCIEFSLTDSGQINHSAKCPCVEWLSTCLSIFPAHLPVCFSIWLFLQMPGGEGGGQWQGLSWSGSRRSYWLSSVLAQPWWALHWSRVRNRSRCVPTSASATRCCRWLQLERRVRGNEWCVDAYKSRQQWDRLW